MAKIIFSLLFALFAVSGGVHGNPIAIFPAEFLECVGSQYLLKPVKETTLEGKYKLRTYTFGDVNRKLADEKIWSIFESKYDSTTTRDVQIEGGFPNPDHGILNKLAKYVEIVVKTNTDKMEANFYQMNFGGVGYFRYKIVGQNVGKLEYSVTLYA